MLFVSHYLAVVFLVQVIGGALPANRFVPLALILLRPIVVNILLFHLLMAPAGLSLALCATVLWGVVFYGTRRVFAGVFAQRA